MEHVYTKEALSLLDRVHLLDIHNKEDGHLQRAIEDIINLVEGITIRSNKETLILFFFTVKCFL